MKMLMMKILMWWEPVCHRTKWQRHCVLRDCYSPLSIFSSPCISKRSTMRGLGGGYCSLPHRRVHLASRTHGLFIT
jgi:hypothetical protein